MSTIADNIAQVEARIRAAALAVQRDVTSVHLLAVSKTKPAAALRDAYAAGLRAEELTLLDESSVDPDGEQVRVELATMPSPHWLAQIARVLQEAG